MGDREKKELLYQIPNCPICLDQLSAQLQSLACGHVFHQRCLMTHLQTRSSCPICQKRISPREMRPIFYRLEASFHGSIKFNQILKELAPSEGRQVETLINKIKSDTDRIEKLTSDNKFMEELLERTKHEKEQMKKITQSHLLLLLEQNKTADIIEKLEDQNRKLRESQLRKSIEIEELRKEEKEMKDLKKLKRMMTEHSQDICNYKTQLENNNTPPESIINEMYNLLMLKHLDNLKIKQKIQEFPSYLNEKTEEIASLKMRLESSQKQLRDVNERRQIQKKKYEDLKVKYKNLLQKAKNKNFKQEELDAYEDSMSRKRDTKTQNEIAIQMPIVASKKPAGSAQSFGGLFKKKHIEKPQSNIPNLLF